MAGFVDTLEAALLDHYFMGTALAQDTNLFVALSTTTPTEAGGNFTEPVGNGYARVSTAGADWNAAVAGAPTVVDNATAITFPQATGSWGTITHFGIYDASTAGNLDVFGALTTSKAIGANDTAEFAAGALDVKLGDPGDTY